MADEVHGYARRFNDTSAFWQKSPEMNLIFLRMQENYMNQRLRVMGHVFLNEVYDGLGLSRTVNGAICGWLLHGDGDGYIDFGLAKDAVVVGPQVLLDFNVDGIIYEKIEGEGAVSMEITSEKVDPVIYQHLVPGVYTQEQVDKQNAKTQKDPDGD